MLKYNKNNVQNKYVEINYAELLKFKLNFTILFNNP